MPKSRDSTTGSERKVCSDDDMRGEMEASEFTLGQGKGKESQTREIPNRGGLPF
jgi:hypothetical protein